MIQQSPAMVEYFTQINIVVENNLNHYQFTSYF
jgi:hypothetical protein